MLYQWYELSRVAVRPARAAADSYRLFFDNPFNPIAHTTMGRSAVAACEVFERTTRSYGKPNFGISTTEVDAAPVAVNERTVWQRPFCRLLHFKRDITADRAAADPRILIVAPMSGHYASLLRGTVEALLPEHEVFITDWQDAGRVPTSEGGFDLSDYITYISDMIGHLGGDVHVVAVCQPAVPVLAAVSLMEAAGNPNLPASMILMGGPVDTRISKTAVNKLAERRGTRWFEGNVIVNVPWSSPGHGRKVYPGFLQLGGFMTMNLDRHVKAHKDMFFHLVRGDGDSAQKHREFYDEYLAVMDLTAEFYLQTIDSVFVKHQLPRGRLLHKGQPVDLSAISRTALMTVEGEKDDITGIGQCAAAHDLCNNIPAARKAHFECPGVGHYGVFNGRRFRNQIVPRIAAFIRSVDARTAGQPRLSCRQPAAEQAGTGRRANSHGTDLSANAFTFAPSHPLALTPANDPKTDPKLQTVTGARRPGSSARRPRPAPHAFAAHAALMQIWGMTGAMMFGNFPGTNGDSKKARKEPIQVRKQA